MERIKFGFVLISHKAHIHHTSPVAFELSKDSRFEVIIYTSTKDNFEILTSIAQKYSGHKCEIKLLQPSYFYKVTRFFKKRIYPGVSEILGRNYKELTSCKALLSPHYNLDYLMDRNNEITYFSLLHGAGDNRIGFSPKLGRFDYLLVSGEEIKQRMLEENILEETKIQIIGYPKFDLIDIIQKSTNKYFENGNPVVQFNPHYLKGYTSWPEWGFRILDYFAKNPNYNLIFAPHIKLFGRRIPKGIKKYSSCKNILIDIKSDALIDMSYTSISDIYLGDISSQVYEFIYKPRPCVFLNPYIHNWEKDKYFKMWHLGDVVSKFEDFETVLSSTFRNHSIYKMKQKNALKGKFFADGNKTAGQRAADIIVKTMNKEN